MPSAQNPVTGASRPREGANEGKTQAISDEQMKALLEAPDPAKHKAISRRLRAIRDRAILSVFAFHGLRCSELANLRIKDIQERRGVKFLCIHGKGDKIRYIPAHTHALERIEDYLAIRGATDRDDFLFLSVRSDAPLNRVNIYTNIVSKYARQARINPHEFCVHSLRATAGTNALENGAHIEEVQQWFGHSSISTTCLYDKRKQRPEDSPTFRVRY